MIPCITTHHHEVCWAAWVDVVTMLFNLYAADVCQYHGLFDHLFKLHVLPPVIQCSLLASSKCRLFGITLHIVFFHFFSNGAQLDAW
jgi:hypothetical protein